jgi:hypothetical protein
MKTNVNTRVEAFIERVQETEPFDVVAEFMSEFDRCADPVRANLAIMLRKARENSSGAAARAHQERNALDNALQHCNS